MASGKLLAFVHASLDWGPILFSTGGFEHELSASGLSNLADMVGDAIPRTTRPGLRLFEGEVDWTGGDDPDWFFVGEWRELTTEELDLVLAGLPPWGEKWADGG